MHSFRKSIIFLSLIALLTAACGSSQPPQVTREITPLSETATPALLDTAAAIPSPSITPTASPTITSTATVAATATATSTPTAVPTEPPTTTPIPTYTTLRAKVIIDQAVCHYGPGAPYLYKYGVYKGSNIEIIRRLEPGNYVEIQAIGGNNPCWLKVDYLEIKGDLTQVQPVDAADVKLPMSPYYGPPTGVSAVRSGNEVTVSWHPVVLRAGDDQGAAPYVVEVWVCQGGKIEFLPIGVSYPLATVTDETGCSQPSRGFVTAAEKHGYTRRVEIVWPQPGTQP